eukprot:4343371-Amphidinium_carterae.1
MEYATSGHPLPSAVVTPGVERHAADEDEKELDGTAAAKYVGVIAFRVVKCVCHKTRGGDIDFKDE